MTHTLPPTHQLTADRLLVDVWPYVEAVRRHVHTLPWVAMDMALRQGRIELVIDIHDDGEPGAILAARLLGNELRTVGLRSFPERWLDCGPNRRRSCREMRGQFHLVEIRLRRLGNVELIVDPAAPVPAWVVTVEEARRLGRAGGSLAHVANRADPRVEQAFAEGAQLLAQHGPERQDSRSGLGS